jgi:hypothetical protein
MSDLALTGENPAVDSDEEGETVVKQPETSGSVEINRESVASANATVPKSKSKMARRLSSAVHVPISTQPDALTDQQKVELSALIAKFPEPPTAIIAEPSAPVFSLTAMKAASSGWMRGIFGSPSAGAPATPEVYPAGTTSAIAKSKSTTPVSTTKRQTIV